MWASSNVEACSEPEDEGASAREPDRTPEGRKMFAVIKTGGKQYRVTADDLLKVEKVAGARGDNIEFTEVLVIGEGAEVVIGTPAVKDAVVTAEVIEQGRGSKVIAFKKRRRQNSKRSRGHRQELTTVRISEILAPGAKSAKKATVDKPMKEEASNAEPGVPRAPVDESAAAGE